MSQNEGEEYYFAISRREIAITVVVASILVLIFL